MVDRDLTRNGLPTQKIPIESATKKPKTLTTHRVAVAAGARPAAVVAAAVAKTSLRKVHKVP